MIRIFLIFSLAILVTNSSYANPYENADWELISDEDGVEVYTADIEGSDDDAAVNEKASFPGLQAHWRRHETDPLAMPPSPDQPREEAKGALPLWLQPQSDKKD